jgi:hypothetical protein
LSAQEKWGFVEHVTRYVTTLLEELNGHMLNFGRYIAEQVKPQDQQSWIAKNSWVWVLILVGFGIILLFLFGPSIYESIAGQMGGVMGDTISTGTTPVKIS